MYGIGQAWRGLLFGVAAVDPVTFVSSAAAVLVLAVAAGLGPALRAARQNPLDALRAE